MDKTKLTNWCLDIKKSLQCMERDEMIMAGYLLGTIIASMYRELEEIEKKEPDKSETNSVQQKFKKCEECGSYQTFIEIKGMKFAVNPNE